MCFGNHAPQMQAIPNPPPEKEIMDFVNHLTGTQTVTVTGADGKRRRVTTRMPRTPEEEENIQLGKDLFISSVKDIRDLYKYDPQSVISFAPLINTVNNIANERNFDLSQFADLGNIIRDTNDFREMQKTLIDEQFQLREEADQRRRAHNGRGGGSFAQEARANMARQHGLARAEGDMKARSYAEDLAAKRLSTNKEAFGLREIGREGTLNAAKVDYALQKEDELDQEQRRLRAIQEKRGQMDIGANIIRYDDAKALQDRTQADSLAMYQAENNVQNQRYGQQVGAIQANNQMAMDEYRNRPPTFGEWAAGAVGNAVGSMWTAPTDSMAGRFGKRFIG